MVKIKFCGMTDLDDCKMAADLGVDFVGFVFYKKSRRVVTPGRAGRIIEGLHGAVRTVGVFVEENDHEIERAAGFCGLDFVQVYRESACANSIRVLRVGERLPDVPGDGLLLFDSASEGIGGSGKPFDHGLLEGCAALDRAFVAGGVDERNVGEVLRMRPFGIDLVSSIEACPGRKDYRKMERFVKTVRGFETC
jgi:phosphoribosylanthranilate isomerase